MKNLFYLIILLFSTPSFAYINANCEDSNAIAKIENVLKPLGEELYACYFPDVHCVNRKKCPAQRPAPPSTCGDAHAIYVSKYHRMANENSCHFTTLYCVDYSLCPQFTPIPKDFCKPGEKIVTTTEYMPISGVYSCPIQKAYCYKEDICPLF